MRQIELGILPNNNMLIVLTMEYVEDGVEIFMADFRDSYGLFHTKTGNWIGLNNIKGVRLCSGSPELKDGMWILKENGHEKLTNIKISSTNIILKELL